MCSRAVRDGEGTLRCDDDVVTRAQSFSSLLREDSCMQHVYLLFYQALDAEDDVEQDYVPDDGEASSDDESDIDMAPLVSDGDD